MYNFQEILLVSPNIKMKYNWLFLKYQEMMCEVNYKYFYLIYLSLIINHCMHDFFKIIMSFNNLDPAFKHWINSKWLSRHQVNNPPH